MAGVPLWRPGRARRGPGRSPPRSTTPVDLDDPLRREEHASPCVAPPSTHHSTLAWRAALGRRAPACVTSGLPAVSALLPTKRPEMLDFALGQLARQRGVEVELVLATHGFAPDRDAVAELARRPAAQVLAFDASTPSSATCSPPPRRGRVGDVVLKIDDDDWYSPDAVHDLLHGPRFSGADVVGMPSSSSTTSSRATSPSGATTPRSSSPASWPAARMLLDRGLLRSLGDFRRVRRFVDAQLLAAVEAAGGRIYRTHGLGYVLRRTGGHTWQRDAEEFRRPDIVGLRVAGLPAEPGARGRPARPA